MNNDVVHVKIIENPAVSVSAKVGTPKRVNIVETKIIAGSGDKYEGAYEFTPSRTEQVISTKDKALQDDIVIKAIPNTYGLVTYDGSKLIIT